MPPNENRLHPDASSKKRFVKNEEPINGAHRLFKTRVAIRLGLEPFIFPFLLFLLSTGLRNNFLFRLASVIILASTF